MMTRSFANRVFAGVCGGLARSTRLNAWLWRILFAALAVASQGVFLVVYLILWWLVPQESLAVRRRGLPLILALLIIAAGAALWFVELRGLLPAPAGMSLLWPILLAALALVYFLKQIRSGGAIA